MIEGIRGTSYKGDISIDDIDVLDGVCPMPGELQESSFQK